VHFQKVFGLLVNISIISIRDKVFVNYL